MQQKARILKELQVYLVVSTAAMLFCAMIAASVGFIYGVIQ